MLDLHLDLRRLRLEEGALPEHFLQQRVVVQLFPGLHDAHDRRVDDVFSFHGGLGNGHGRLGGLLLLLDQADRNLDSFVDESIVHLKLCVIFNLLVIAIVLQKPVLGHGHGEQMSAAFLCWHLRCFGDLFESDRLPLVEEHERQALVGRHHKDVLALEAQGSHLNLAHVVNPPELSPGVLRLVEGLESLNALHHFLARHDVGFVCLLGPRVRLQHAYFVTDAPGRASVRLLVVFPLELVTQRHVREHGLQLLNCLLPNLDFQLADKGFLSIGGNRQLVQQPLGQRTLVVVQEDILVLQVCEQSDHRVNEPLSLVFVATLQALLELQIGIQRQVLGTAGVLIQDVFQATISGLLKARIVLEASGNHLVELFFQLQHLFNVLRWVVDILLILDDFRTPGLDVRLHDARHVRQHGRLSSEKPIHQCQIIVLRVDKHVLATRIHLDQLLRCVQDELPLAHLSQRFPRGSIQIATQSPILV
mmetsp:Transcript_22143/g.61947  ORF Transcript_22143/g.61947 Transcript_22143/m.61947 type:complete len:476 (-) Transcript_22143:886-2313(-)